MYFGLLAPWEWPLAMLAMTLDVPGAPREGLAVDNRMASINADGSYTVSINVAGLGWVRSRATAEAADNLCARSWWRQLCLDYKISAEIWDDTIASHSEVPVVLSAGVHHSNAARSSGLP
jgi:hypothetical protein